jgi:hypothetical protein
MDFTTILLIVCAVCIVLAGLLGVAYSIINKEPPQQAALVSDEIARELMQQQKALNKGPQYTNVWNTQIGYDSKTILQTLSLDPWTCMSTCSGSGGTCYGFQIHSDGQTCDLLNSNISDTYGFTNTGWNYFQLTNKTPNKTFKQGISGQCGSGGQVASTVTNATQQDCANYCKSNAACTFIEFGPSGCKLWGQSSTKLVSGCPTGSTIYELGNIVSSAATRPSTSPATS